VKVPVNEPVIADGAKKYVLDALETGWISSAGKYISLFEETFAAFIDVKHAITVTSGTSALHLALTSLNIGKGDEVILPDFTMIACLDAVLYTGATPVFVDVDPETYCIDTDQIASKITDRTKAIMPVHIYGHSADMDPILVLAEKHNLYVIEDAAEVHGGTYKGKKCGGIGTVGCFSFYGNKIISTGEGGMLVTNDDEIAARARSLKDLAHDSNKRFWHKEVGYNYRMTNMQAALGLGQTESVDTFLAHKKWMASNYTSQLKDIDGLRLPITKDYAENVYWMYGILVENSFPLTKDELRSALQEKGVDTRDFFYSISSMPIADPYRTDDKYPVTQDISKRGFYLPSGLALTEEQLTYVCDVIKEIATS
jgi:perosamine synthetase